MIEIRNDSKDVHLHNIRAKTNVPFEHCAFFDDQAGNCRTVASLGCTVYHTVQGGVTDKAWQTMLATFPSPGRVLPC